MISNQLTTIEVLPNNELTKLDWKNFQIEKYSNLSQEFSTNRKTNIKGDDTITSLVSTTTTDTISQRNSDQSTHLSYHLFSPSKSILNEHNPNLILTKQKLSHQIHRSTSDYIDWTNHQSNTSSIETTINNQLDAINFLQEYLQHGNSDVLIDLLHEIAQEMNLDQHQNPYSYAAINNNHLHLTSTYNSKVQLSNNKEKKNKKEKKDDKKKENDNEMTSKKSKEKTKKIEETSTTDSDVIVNSPSLINPTRINLNNPKSPAETVGYPSLSIPVPHSGGSSTNGLNSSEPSRIHIPHQSNSEFAHLSQVQHQLQTDPQNSSLNKTTDPHNMSVQEQLQSLSQMARDGDEILITLSVNALTQKQQINKNNPYSSQSGNLMMPRNLEIVAKGFARVQNEHPQPSTANQYSQQQSMMHPYNPPPYTSGHPPFVPRYPIPCHSSNGPPQLPIGPPIRPIFAPPNMMMSGGIIRPPNSPDFTPSMGNTFDTSGNRSYMNAGNCDYLCQSTLYQPDFRGRPSPGVITNPYISNPPPSMDSSAKRSSKHKSNYSSTKNKSNQLHNMNFENMNRTYSSIY